MTHVRLRPPAMHRDQQLEQEVGLAKCNRVLPLTMCLLNLVAPASCALSLYFLRLLKWSICCRLSFLCRWCTVLDSLFVFCLYLPICHAGSSVPSLFSSYFGWFFAFLFVAPIFIDTCFRSFAYSFPVRVSVRFVRAAFMNLFELLHGFLLLGTVPLSFCRDACSCCNPASPCDALEVGMGSLVGAKIRKEHLQVKGFVLRVVPKQ